MHYGLYRKDVPMFFSSIHADYTKMGYPAAIVRALNFLKHTDLKALSGGRHAIEYNQSNLIPNEIAISTLTNLLMKGLFIVQKGIIRFSFPLISIVLC